MIEILFKNVGQGDSIFLEWTKDLKLCYGLIDCNLYNNTNPLLNEIAKRGVKHLEFIFLSHLHHDHYSGMGELLEYCIQNKIIIERFYHTFTNEYLEILEQQFLTVKQQKDTYRLLDAIEMALQSKIILDIDEISHNFNAINLYGNVNLRFLAPIGLDKITLAEQHSLFKHKKTTTRPDFNLVATIVYIGNNEDFILLTSDAPKRNFRRIRNKLSFRAKLIQAPHHGSPNNLDEKFWEGLLKSTNCDAVFSVGHSKKDRLPKREVVEFFDKQGFLNSSTNHVFGIEEYYGPSKPIKVNQYLRTFAKAKNISIVSSSLPTTRFAGDKQFKIAL